MILSLAICWLWAYMRESVCWGLPMFWWWLAYLRWLGWNSIHDLCKGITYLSVYLRCYTDSVSYVCKYMKVCVLQESVLMLRWGYLHVVAGVIGDIFWGYALLVSIRSYWAYPRDMWLGRKNEESVFRGYDLCFFVMSGGCIKKCSTFTLHSFSVTS